MRIAYLCSRYPLISHTFVMREIEALRELGMVIDTFSVHSTPRAMLLSDADLRAHATTTSLLPARAGTLIAALVRAVVSAPMYVALAPVRTIVSSGGLCRRALWQMFYFAEALLLWNAMHKRGLRHVHVHFANPASDVAMAVAQLGQACDGAGSWTWSFTLHGPSDLFNVEANRLADKAAAALFVACISDFARSQLMGQLPVEAWDKLHVVRCGVDPEVFAPHA